MAAPTYFHSASNPADNGAANEPTTLAVTPPASMVSGDLVVLPSLVQVVSGTVQAIVQASGQTWNGPTGTTGQNDLDFTFWWCQFNGTWGADPSVSVDAQTGTQPFSVFMHVFRPAAAGTWAVDTAAATASEASADPVVITGITPNNNDNVTLAGWALGNISTWGTISGTGWSVVETAQYRNSAGSDQSAAFAYQLQGTKAATGDVSLKPSTAAVGLSFTAAWYVIPAGAGGGTLVNGGPLTKGALVEGGRLVGR